MATYSTHQTEQVKSQDQHNHAAQHHTPYPPNETERKAQISGAYFFVFVGWTSNKRMHYFTLALLMFLKVPIKYLLEN